MDRLAAMTTFVRVVESGSFSAAARQLAVGQPAVSKTVAQLEAHLGVRLLIRSTRGLTPTEGGLRFYERARRSIDEANEAEAAARSAGSGLSGTLRVSAATTFARLHIVPHLAEFLAVHPKLEMDLVIDDRVIDLLEEGIDVSLRLGDLTDSPMVARRLAQSPLSVMATEAYLTRAGEPQTPADLANHQAIVYTQDRTVSWSFRREPSEVSVCVSGRLRVSGAEGIRAAVLADMGLAIASDWMFAPELASGRVRRVLTSWMLPALPLWAVYPTGRLVSARTRLFVTFVQAKLRELAVPAGA